MPKMSGLGWTALNIDNSSASLQDVKNDFTNLDFSLPVATIDTTGIDKYAMERITGLRDFTVTLTGPFNPDANHSHAVFKDITAVASPARKFNLTIGAQVLGITPAFTVLFTEYSLSRGTDGAFTATVPGVLASGDIPAWTT
jgi:hypothetical protein